MQTQTKNILWRYILTETKAIVKSEPILTNFIERFVFSQANLASSLSTILAHKLADTYLNETELQPIFNQILTNDPYIIRMVCKDLITVIKRDPATTLYSTPLLYLKGFHAIQNYRIMHNLWLNNQQQLAFYLQNQASLIWGIDIHPAAQIGYGLLCDHATGLVIGETTIIENNVSILQNVTLGGTGKATGDRHPKIGSGVMIGAGAKILGNIKIGKNVKIGAGSVVLNDIPANTTAVGVPAKVICSNKSIPSSDMQQDFS